MNPPAGDFFSPLWLRCRSYPSEKLKGRVSGLASASFYNCNKPKNLLVGAGVSEAEPVPFFSEQSTVSSYQKEDRDNITPPGFYFNKPTNLQINEYICTYLPESAIVHFSSGLARLRRASLHIQKVLIIHYSSSYL